MEVSVGAMKALEMVMEISRKASTNCGIGGM